MESESRNLQLSKPLIALAVIVVIIACLVVILSQLDKKRKQGVYDRYANETNAYVARNQQGIQMIFSMFPDKMCPEYPMKTSICYVPNNTQLQTLISHDIKDYSSMGFLKLSQNGDILFMGLGGSYQIFNSYSDRNKNDQIAELLRGNMTMLPWEDYTYNFPNREVIIPVTNNNGKIIGAIIRAVIE